jgi:hypothetical protein
MQATVSSNISAAPNEFFPRVNLNLGTIGRLDSHHVWRLFGDVASSDRTVALAEAHEGLPRPAHELDCKVLEAPTGTPLLVLGARHHDVAYYVLANLSEAGCWSALKRVLKTRRIELGLTTSGIKPMWTSLHFEDQAAESLEAYLTAQSSCWTAKDDSWRDRVGLVLLRLPELMAAAHPQAPRCILHAAVLVSGDHGKHSRNRQRCLEAIDERTRAV